MRKSTVHSILLLDYDGTLAPFRVDRKKATIYPSILPILQKLIKKKTTKVVIVTGRAMKDVLHLLPFHPLPEVWGSHGLERLTHGTYSRKSLLKKQKAALKLAEEIVDITAQKAYVEKKPFSIAVHVRGMPPKKKKMILGELERLWKPLTKNRLELHFFADGIEIRPEGKNKGLVIEHIVKKYPKNTFIAYLGDDKTDEDAFQALGKRGLKIRVAKKKKKTLADKHIRPPHELADFLNYWLAL